MNQRGFLQFLLGLLFLAAAVLALRAGWFAPVERRAVLNRPPAQSISVRWPGNAHSG